MKKTDISITALTEAKNIYTNRLCKLLENELYEGVKSIWMTCKKEKNCLSQFQKKLESVPTWNTLILDDEIKRIKSKIKYDYFDKLIDAIFITNAKILTSISNSKVKVKVNIPTTSKFIHHCYISLAYNLYTDPCLVDDRIKNYQELQSNFKTLMSMIKSSIKETIENLLPMDDLLDSCLVDNIVSDTEDEDENESDTEPLENSVNIENIEDQETTNTPNLDVSNGNTISEVVDNYYNSSEFQQQEIVNPEENSYDHQETHRPQEFEETQESQDTREEQQSNISEDLIINLSDYNPNDKKEYTENYDEYKKPEENQQRQITNVPTFFD
jgi:hypothetical protein